MTDTSPAVLLRHAATQMREHETQPWILAVADLLDFTAATSDLLDAIGQAPDNQPTRHYAVAVARTYLGVEAAGDG
jgi:hypothetical protein